MHGPIVDRRRGSRRTQGRGRRRYPRVCIQLDGFYASLDRMMFTPRGDLNLRGVFVSTAVPDAPGTAGVVRLTLPGGVSMLKIPTRVMWSNEDERFGPRGMGLRFEGALEWQLKRVAAALIRKAGLSSIDAEFERSYA